MYRNFSKPVCPINFVNLCSFKPARPVDFSNSMCADDGLRSVCPVNFSKSVCPVDALKLARSVNFNKIICNVNSDKLNALLFLIHFDTRKLVCHVNSCKPVLPIDVRKSVRPVTCNKPVHTVDVCKSGGPVFACKLVCLVDIRKPFFVDYWKHNTFFLILMFFAVSINTNVFNRTILYVTLLVNILTTYLVFINFFK